MRSSGKKIRIMILVAALLLVVVQVVAAKWNEHGKKDFPSKRIQINQFNYSEVETENIAIDLGREFSVHL